MEAVFDAYAVGPLAVGVAGLITALIALYQLGANKRATESTAGKAEADSEAILVETAMALLKPLRERIESLEGLNHELEERIDKLEREIG